MFKRKVNRIGIADSRYLDAGELLTGFGCIMLSAGMLLTQYGHHWFTLGAVSQFCEEVEKSKKSD